MNDSFWHDTDMSDFDELPIIEKKRHKKQSKRKWREIEALKEQRREQKEVASYSLCEINAG